MSELSDYAGRYETIRMERRDGILLVTLHSEGGPLQWGLTPHRELPLAFPTLTQLQLLRSFGSSEEALSHYRGRTMEPTLPVIVGEGDARRIVLPGDPDYPAEGGEQLL